MTDPRRELEAAQKWQRGECARTQAHARRQRIDRKNLLAMIPLSGRTIYNMYQRGEAA